MLFRKFLFPCLILMASVALVLFHASLGSLSHGQDRSLLPASAASPGPPPPRSGLLPTAASNAGERVLRDLSRLPPLQQQMYLSAQRGADWLCRANQADGHFLPGYLPALKMPLEGDHFLRQAGAAFALARTAHFLGQQHYAAVARQAVLTLLLETALDPQDAHVRRTTLPPLLVNPLGAAGLLILAINELPAPGDDLLEQSEQLCAFLRRRQASDGSLNYADAAGQAETDPESINHYPGLALYALMRSQRYRPAAWKTAVVSQALPCYRTWWRAHKTATFIPWQSAAYTEAFLLTHEPSLAEFVIEMNDWLCTLQYVQLDPRHPLWFGGFRENAEDGAAPQATSALYAEGLAEACRLIRLGNDPPRAAQYREALERCLQFLNTLQYTEANTQHFAEWYRPILMGAFHASHQDGNVRIDYTQHAVSALVQYLTYLGEWNVPAVESRSPAAALQSR